MSITTPPMGFVTRPPTGQATGDQPDILPPGQAYIITDSGKIVVNDAGVNLITRV